MKRVFYRFFRLVRRSWSWTPVDLPLRDPLCSQETSATTNTSSKSPLWVFDCWKEVRKTGRIYYEFTNIFL